jgi:hypothetical protein
MTLQVHQDGAELIAAPKREVVYPEKEDRPSRDIGEI